jgi:hypothetical protein
MQTFSQKSASKPQRVKSRVSLCLQKILKWLPRSSIQICATRAAFRILNSAAPVCAAGSVIP